jgi:hypothetical protein
VLNLTWNLRCKGNPGFLAARVLKVTHRKKNSGRMNARVTVVTKVIKNPVDSTARYFFAIAHYGDRQ